MDRNQKRRRRAVLIGALFVATLTTGWLCRPEPTLIDISRAVGPFNREKQTWGWLSDEELIAVTTDTEPDNLLGAVSDEIHWQGHAELWNVNTGKRTPLSGLTALLNRERISPTGLPFDFKLSPNRTFLLWDNCKTLDQWPCPAAAHMDGTHYREWNSDTRGDGFFVDDQHWVEHDVSTPSSVHILDLEDKRRDRKYPVTSPQAKVTLALHAVQHPHFVNVDFLDDQRSVVIATYRTEDWAAFARSDGDAPDKAIPLSKGALKLPSGARMLRGKESPDQRMILYHIHSAYTNPVQALLHLLHLEYSKPPLETESLWVSEADGQGFHEIGHVVVPFVPSDVPSNTEHNELTRIEWLPGGKQVAFVYHDTLYVVPAK